MGTTIVIPKGTTIYRYDIASPPEKWSDDYRSLEYKDWIMGGHKKNHGGFYYFFSNKQVAVNTAKVACAKANKKEFILTECTITTHTYLLDLAGCRNTVLMFLKLKSLGIDVLTDNYHIYTDHDCHALSLLKEPSEYILSESISSSDKDIDLLEKYNNTIQSYLNIPGCPYSILGQTLTDFANGIKFKQELRDHYFDGYCFDESIGGSTIRLLDSSKLSPPSQQRISL